MTTRLGGVALALLLALGLAQPAQAASTPGSVGLVSFTAAAYSHRYDTTSLTLDWHNARNATKYEIFMSRSYSMSNAKRYTTSSSTKKITRLQRGKSYYFQVRAVNGTRVGSKSSRVGHTTIRRQGSSTPPLYRVMTYNLCSDLCPNWSGREEAFLGRVATYHPDVLALQESSEFARGRAAFGEYTATTYKSAKSLYYKTDRFDLGGTDYISLGNGRYAVWAELIDKKSQQRVIFVSAHTTSGKSESSARARESEATRLLDGIAEINGAGLPVVYAGDFNSHKNRSNDYIARVFQRAGYYDGYDLAMRLTRQHYNSYNDFQTRPVTSVKWGDHVDHVWSDPETSRVTKWSNGVLLKSNRLVTPIPSDHSPIIVDVQLDDPAVS